MKTLVTLLGLMTACFLSGEAAVVVMIRAYDDTGLFGLEQGNVLRGTRLLLTCDVSGLPEGSVITSYKWYHNCSTGRCEIQRETPYYKPVNDTLLVDATSWGGGKRRHICDVEYRSAGGRTSNQIGFTASISLADSTTPFFYTPTYLLLNHSIITDVQQITGRNGQHWINCTSGTREANGGGVYVLSVRDSPVAGNGMSTTGIGPERYPSNGLYYCLEGQEPRYYISLFLKKSSNLPTPTIHAWGPTAWTLTSPSGSLVEGYIVEFECRVRNITFVEKYMSVSASGGNVPVVRDVSCFGGQLYRVKVWAVSGPNISRQPAEKLVNTDGPTQTTQVLTTTPTTSGSTGTTPSTAPTSTGSVSSSSTPSDDSKPEGSPFIGVGIGAGFGLLLVVLALIASIVVVVVVKRRAAIKQTGSIKMRANPCYNNPVVIELEEKDVAAEYDDTVINKENGSITVGFDPYEDVDSKAQNKNAKTPPPKASFTPVRATDVGELYAVVDKGAKKKEEENGCIGTNKEDLYTVPVKKKDKVTDGGMGVNGATKKSEDDDEVAELEYEPKADSESEKQSEGDEKPSNADMLYAVVDKSRKKKK